MYKPITKKNMFTRKQSKIAKSVTLPVHFGAFQKSRRVASEMEHNEAGGFHRCADELFSRGEVVYFDLKG